MRGTWPKVRLGEVLRHRKEFVIIDDLAVYKRPRVQLHAKGIVMRDEIPGASIKTKKQQISRAGEFLVAEIDAKVGGFGLVPESLDGAIVSSHYFIFKINADKLDRGFLDYFIRTPGFREQVEAQGSTNYAAIRPADVLNYEIPLPPLEEQRRIVARIEELAGLVQEARGLRERVEEEADAVITSLHAKLSGNRVRKIEDLLFLDEDYVGVEIDNSYPQVGIRSFGGGMFPKAAVGGLDTTYKRFIKLFSGALVLSQVKGWEGAVAVCPDDLNGWFVSPEYRTFRCIPSESRPSYLASLIRTEWFWSRLAEATRGVGARRERTRPEQFLGIELPMPSVDKQELGEQIFSELNDITALHLKSVSEMDTLMPSILDRAFKGEL